jgi:hypothetical protein
MAGLVPAIHDLVSAMPTSTSALTVRPEDVDCMMLRPSVRWGRRRALRDVDGLYDRGHLGPAGVAV